MTGHALLTNQLSLLFYFNLILLIWSLAANIVINYFLEDHKVAFPFMRKKPFNVADTNLGSITGRQKHLQTFFHEAR